MSSEFAALITDFGLIKYHVLPNFAKGEVTDETRLATYVSKGVEEVRFKGDDLVAVEYEGLRDVSQASTKNLVFITQQTIPRFETGDDGNAYIYFGENMNILQEVDNGNLKLTLNGGRQLRIDNKLFTLTEISGGTKDLVINGSTKDYDKAMLISKFYKFDTTNFPTTIGDFFNNKRDVNFFIKFETRFFEPVYFFATDAKGDFDPSGKKTQDIGAQLTWNVNHDSDKTERTGVAIFQFATAKLREDVFLTYDTNETNAPAYKMMFVFTYDRGSFVEIFTNLKLNSQNVRYICESFVKPKEIVTYPDSFSKRSVMPVVD